MIALDNAGLTSSNQVTGFLYTFIKQSFGTEECIGSTKGYFRDALLRFRARVSRIKARSVRLNPVADTPCLFDDMKKRMSCMFCVYVKGIVDHSVLIYRYQIKEKYKNGKDRNNLRNNA